MPIVPSRSRETQALVARLSSQSAADREAAVARLRLLGPRAVPAMLAVLPGSGPELRLCVLELLEHTPDPRALAEVMALCRDRDAPVARRALALLPRLWRAEGGDRRGADPGRGPPDLRIPAVRALCGLHGRGVVEALEPLIDAILDEAEEERFRLEALASLQSVDPKTAATLRERLARGTGLVPAATTRTSFGTEGEPASPRALLDRLEHQAMGPDETVRTARALEAMGAAALPGLHAVLDRAADPRLVSALAEVAGRLHSPTSIPVLSRALKRLADLPRRATDEGRREAASRIHVALAALDSRIALFDLRERLQAAPIGSAVPLLAAAERIGDASLLAALARLYAEEPAPRGAVASAFAAIVGREKLRPRSAALRSLKAEDREALEALWATLPGGYSRTRPVMGTKRTGRTRRSS